MAYDLKRTEKKWNDCFGIYFCKPNSKICCEEKYIYDQPGSQKYPLIRKFMKNYYAPFFMKTPIKIILLLAVSTVIGINLYGVTKL